MTEAISERRTISPRSSVVISGHQMTEAISEPRTISPRSSVVISGHQMTEAISERRTISPLRLTACPKTLARSGYTTGWSSGWMNRVRGLVLF
jgi:hypothetical protein